MVVFLLTHVFFFYPTNTGQRTQPNLHIVLPHSTTDISSVTVPNYKPSETLPWKQDMITVSLINKRTSPLLPELPYPPDLAPSLTCVTAVTSTSGKEVFWRVVLSTAGLLPPWFGSVIRSALRPGLQQFLTLAASGWLLPGSNWDDRNTIG